MEIRTKNFLKKYLAAAVGVVFSIWISGVITCGTFDINQLVPQGEVHEYSRRNLTGSSATFLYDKQKKCFVLDSDVARKRFGKIKSSREMHYIFMEISHLQQESVEAVLEYRDENDDYRGCQSVELKNGENWVWVLAPEFRYFTLQVEGHKGLEISFDKMQVREGEPVSKKIFVLIAAISFLGYFVLINWTTKFYKKKTEKTFCRNSSSYSVFHEIYQNVKKKSETTHKMYSFHRKKVRVCICCILFLYMYLVNVLGWYSKTEYYKYHMLLACICLFLLGVFSIRETRGQAEREHDIKWSRIWVCFCVFLCISDFWASKFYKFSGWMFLIFFGFAFYCWKKNQAGEEILGEIFSALKILFWPGVLFCFFCRQKKGAILYNGIYRDSKEFAVYALVMFFIFVSDYVFILEGNKQKKSQIRLCELGAAVSAYFLLVSGSLACILAGGCFGCYVFWRRRKLWKRNTVIFRSLCFCVVFTALFHLGLRNLPQRIGTNVTFYSETLESWKSQGELDELKQIDPENYKSVKRKQESELGGIWRAYLRNAGALGSKKKSLYIHGGNRNPQNHVVSILFRYGVFAGIFYTGILIMAAGRAFAILRGKKCSKTELAYVGCSLAFVFVGMVTELEKPFLLPVWVIFYLGLGAEGVVLRDQF